MKADPLHSLMRAHLLAVSHERIGQALKHKSIQLIARVVYCWRYVLEKLEFGLGALYLPWLDLGPRAIQLGPLCSCLEGSRLVDDPGLEGGQFIPGRLVDTLQPAQDNPALFQCPQCHQTRATTRLVLLSKIDSFFPETNLAWKAALSALGELTPRAQPPNFQIRPALFDEATRRITKSLLDHRDSGPLEMLDDQFSLHVKKLLWTYKQTIERSAYIFATTSAPAPVGAPGLTLLVRIECGPALLFVRNGLVRLPSAVQGASVILCSLSNDDAPVIGDDGTSARCPNRHWTCLFIRETVRSPVEIVLAMEEFSKVVGRVGRPAKVKIAWSSVWVSPVYIELLDTALEHLESVQKRAVRQSDDDPQLQAASSPVGNVLTFARPVLKHTERSFGLAFKRPFDIEEDRAFRKLIHVLVPTTAGIPLFTDPLEFGQGIHDPHACFLDHIMVSSSLLDKIESSLYFAPIAVEHSGNLAAFWCDSVIARPGGADRAIVYVEGDIAYLVFDFYRLLVVRTPAASDRLESKLQRQLFSQISGLPTGWTIGLHAFSDIVQGQLLLASHICEHVEVERQLREALGVQDQRRFSLPVAEMLEYSNNRMEEEGTRTPDSSS